MIAKLWVGLDNAKPVTDPVGALQRLAGALESMTDVLGERVDALKAVEAGEDLSKVRGTVAMFERTVTRWAAVLVDMNRLGIAQQRLALERDQAQLVGSGLIDGFHALALTPDQIELFMGAFRSRIKDQLTELGTGSDRANGVLSPVDNHRRRGAGMTPEAERWLADQDRDDPAVQVIRRALEGDDDAAAEVVAAVREQRERRRNARRRPS